MPSFFSLPSKFLFKGLITEGFLSYTIGSRDLAQNNLSGEIPRLIYWNEVLQYLWVLFTLDSFRFQPVVGSKCFIGYSTLFSVVCVVTIWWAHSLQTCASWLVYGICKWSLLPLKNYYFFPFPIWTYAFSLMKLFAFEVMWEITV